MKMKHRLLSVNLTLGALAIIPAAALAAGAFDGTWNVNLNHIQLPNRPDTHIVKDGEYTCSSCTPAYTITADGTDQPVAGQAAYDTMAIKVIDASTLGGTEKLHGKVILTFTVTVSADGATAVTDERIFGGSQPIGEKVSYARVAAAPPGAHAASGTWRIVKVELSGEQVTYGITDDGFTMSDNEGDSFEAKFDGKQYPVVVAGERAPETVTVKRLGPTQVEERRSLNGKPVTIVRLTVSRDGQTIHVSSTNARTHATVRYTLDKVS